MEKSPRFQGLTPTPTSLQWSPEEAEEVAYSCAPPQLASEWADPLVLHQFNPAWDILAFLRFHPSLNVHVINSRYPAYAATGVLPQLQDGHFRLGGGSLTILMHIQTHYLDEDNPQLPLLCHALNQVVSTTGQAILNASAFGNATTYEEVTRPQLAAKTLFPLQTFLTREARATALAQSQGVLQGNDVFGCTRDFYQLLVDQLQQSSSGPYFFGNTPTSCDALVFGHVVKALNDPTLGPVIPPALVSFAQHIRETFFSGKQAERYYSVNQDLVSLSKDTDFMQQHKPVLVPEWIQKPYQSLSAGFRARSIVKNPPGTHTVVFRLLGLYVTD